MLKEFQGFTKVYIACGYTDLRNGTHGLAVANQNQFHLDSFDQGILFLFCGSKSDRIKGLDCYGRMMDSFFCIEELMMEDSSGRARQQISEQSLIFSMSIC
jgi:hypothetical protein